MVEKVSILLDNVLLLYEFTLSIFSIKVILPASALDHLTRLHIQFPMLFKLTNRSKKRSTHCGVLEFVADEGRCYLPYWVCMALLNQNN